MQTLIHAAGLHLLDVLKADKAAVTYSRFYNDGPDTDRKLADAVLLRHEPAGDEEEAKSIRARLLDEAHLHVEWAAWQLVDRGVVRITFLDGVNLIDGEPDFRIELTPMGEEFVRDGGQFGFRDPDSRLRGKGASLWLIAFVAEGRGEALTLHDVMTFGESDGEVEVTDDCGNAYPLGSRAYAWAFEVALWHHARSGNVVPVPEDDGQKAAWAKMAARRDLFGPPDMEAPHPLWEVPFRIAPGTDTRTVRHLGWFGGE